MSATRLPTTNRLLPGLRFEAQQPPLAESLPRMDIAVFVGFASRGPINQPVVVEDSAQFAAIFGEDALLCWDTDSGTTLRAYLGPAIRDFFRQGGRRCWVVRVARDAKCNYFPIPYLLECRAGGPIFPAFARASSEGSWSDALRVGVSLQARAVEVRHASFADYEFELSLSSPGDVRTGDLLRFNIRDERYGLFCVVESLEAVEQSANSVSGDSAKQREATRRRTVRAICARPFWYQTLHLESPPLSRPDRALVFYQDGASQTIDVIEPPLMEAETIRLGCALAFADAPAPGTVMRVDFGTRQLWLTVRDVRSHTGGAATTASVQIAGEGYWPLSDAPVLPQGVSADAERLTFKLLAHESEGNPASLGELGFDEQHPRYWGDWPADYERYQDMRKPVLMADARSGSAPAHEPFPLAGRSRNSAASDESKVAGGGRERSALYLPLAMPFMASELLGPVKQTQPALERDGLAAFDAELFLDPKLMAAYAEELLAEADYLRYQSTSARSLTGIHTALDIEEATIIAVPDAVHRGWRHRPSEQPAPVASSPVAHPEWWRFLDCNPAPSKLPEAREPLWGNFLDCDLKVLLPPTLKSDEAPAPGTISLSWSGVAGASRYTVEESRSPAWDDAVPVYQGADTHLIIYGRSAGDFYYRVRAESACAKSDWSTGIGVRTVPATEWQVEKREDYEASVLVYVHRALLRLCVARGDIFAVLTLPEHYREDNAITHADIIRPTPKPLNQASSMKIAVPPLSLGEERATSYGALYHPWLVSHRDDPLGPWRSAPPDGAACGVMAARALMRGAWIAPANELLRGVVALSPPLKRERWQEMQDAQVNIFRHEPRGFLSLSADTLSLDVDVRSIGVRRLLILLRRLALRLGATYVFEPNDDSFRRLVQRGFEAALDQMFARGAFAGHTAATSYQVATDNFINTPASMDQGRFIVEMRVAPAEPLTFITIRMTQAGDRSFVTEV